MQSASRSPTKMTANALPSQVKYSVSFMRCSAFCQLGLTSVVSRFGSSLMYLYSIFNTAPRLPSLRIYSLSGLPTVILSKIFQQRTCASKFLTMCLLTNVVFFDSGVLAI